MRCLHGENSAKGIGNQKVEMIGVLTNDSKKGSSFEKELEDLFHYRAEKKGREIHV